MFSLNQDDNDIEDILDLGTQWKKPKMSRIDAPIMDRQTTNFVHRLIRANGTFSSTDGFSLSIHDVDPLDKKLFLSYILEPSEFEDFCENYIRLQAGFKEYEKVMQACIDQEVDEVYHEDMQEMGLALRIDNENGEHIWIRH